jgi:hypothetical protein
MLVNNFVKYLGHYNNKDLNKKLSKEYYIEKLVEIEEMLVDNFVKYRVRNNNKDLNNKMI